VIAGARLLTPENAALIAWEDADFVRAVEARAK
jgi:hypothetical protein